MFGDSGVLGEHLGVQSVLPRYIAAVMNSDRISEVRVDGPQESKRVLNLIRRGRRELRRYRRGCLTDKRACGLEGCVIEELLRAITYERLKQ